MAPMLMQGYLDVRETFTAVSELGPVRSYVKMIVGLVKHQDCHEEDSVCWEECEYFFPLTVGL
jgi:hypothetical protein